MNKEEETQRLKDRIKELEDEVALLRKQLAKVKNMGQKPFDDEDTIKRIFNLYRQDNSLGDIAELLNEDEISTKRGGKWHKATVKYILQNHQYVSKGYITEDAYTRIQQQLRNNRLWNKK